MNHGVYYAALYNVCERYFKCNAFVIVSLTLLGTHALYSYYLLRDYYCYMHFIKYKFKCLETYQSIGNYIVLFLLICDSAYM